jgi:hypothetical protein
MSKIGVGTSYATDLGSTIHIVLTNKAGEAIFVVADGTPSTIIGSAAGYATGCIAEDSSAPKSLGLVQYNAGTSTTASFTNI